MRRAAALARLGAGRFDLLIIGGGIVGAGIARDAAMRGLSVALIEQGDFAGGTSSKTSKLIHGGLRYLEHGRLRLVRESLCERAVLRGIAPSMVRPVSILLPSFHGDRRSPGTIRLGLWLYGLLAAGRQLRAPQLVSARRALTLEPGLRVEGLRAAGLYADCQMDDARLCLSNILQAASFGAACANYVRLTEFLRAGQRLCGAAAEDVLTGRTIEIQAATVVNATGPWSDRVRRVSEASAPERLSPTKGIHVILPKLLQEALFVQSRMDRRMIFLLPYGDYTLVGTTESRVDGPLEGLQATADEVDYLLSEVNRVLPGSHVSEADVISTFAGARPLLAFSGGAAGASREHRIDIDRWGLISILGGKYTTYRRMAAQVVDVVAAGRPGKGARPGDRGWRAGERCLTDQVSLIETVHPITLSHWQELTRNLDPDLLARLLIRYGTASVAVLRWLAHDPSLAAQVCPHHEYSYAELLHVLDAEFACTVTDVLARRTRIAWSSCQGLDALSRFSELLERHAGWTRPVIEQQLEQYHQFLAGGLAFRPGLTPFRDSAIR